MSRDYLFDPKSKALSRGDYRPSEYTITRTELEFDLDDTATVVKSKLNLKRNPDLKDAGGPLILDGENMKLMSVKMNGKDLDRQDFTVTDQHLVIKRPPVGPFTLEIQNEINPSANTKLSGLYKSGDMLLTQCEAQGFRRITYYLDRPDVLSSFKVTLRGDKDKYPVLLSNGNGDPAKSKKLEGGRHEISWEDPHPKPAYLFALAGGQLETLEDTFTTMSGKDVTLRIFVQKGYEDKIDWAMGSIKRSMKWDEEAYGREYDLDVFHVVATDKFNFGAMENKGLNIFNVNYLVGDPKVSTDRELTAIEAVIGHEYFHNWSGDRVTVRDWFELTLKEGFTVLRDRQFTEDMHSRSIKQIEDATALKSRQFLEDASPNAHPIRPDRVEQFENIYSGTIYEKGSHVLGMMRTMVGPKVWRKCTDEYFSRFDGKAVTCDDFINVVQEVSGKDLSQFRRWYSQSGTPEISYHGEYDAKAKTYKLTLTQNTPATADQAQDEKKDLHMPIAIGLISQSGKDINLFENNTRDAVRSSFVGTKVLELKHKTQTFEFTDVEGPVVPSINRGFSAPVKVVTQPSTDELIFRMAHDSDGYNRYEAYERYATKVLLDLTKDHQAGKPLKLPQAFVEAYGNNLAAAQSGDRAFAAMMLDLPDRSIVEQSMKVLDPLALKAAEDFTRKTLVKSYKDEFTQLYKETTAPKGETYEVTPDQVRRRALHNVALSYLHELGAKDSLKLVDAQYQSADNMTERLCAFALLTKTSSPEGKKALESFYKKFKNTTPTVIDKWFSLQASAPHGDALKRTNDLMKHSAYDKTTPNRVRALIGGFIANTEHFHKEDGSGYKFVADTVIEMNGINPKTATMLAKSLTLWRRYDKKRGGQMKAELERIMKTPKLDGALQEVVGNALKAPKKEEPPAKKPGKSFKQAAGGGPG